MSGPRSSPSQNLTAHALNLNMELGVLIRGGPLPAQIAGHWRELMRSGVLAEVGF